MPPTNPILPATPNLIERAVHGLSLIELILTKFACLSATCASTSHMDSSHVAKDFCNSAGDMISYTVNCTLFDNRHQIRNKHQKHRFTIKPFPANLQQFVTAFLKVAHCVIAIVSRMGEVQVQAN